MSTTERVEASEPLPSTPALDEESPFATMMSQFDSAAKKRGITAA